MTPHFKDTFVFLAVVLIIVIEPSQQLSLQGKSEPSRQSTTFGSEYRKLLVNTESRITGGRQVPKGRLPYICNIRNQTTREVICGGTLISDRWLLTAAHCVDPNSPNATGPDPVIHCGAIFIEHGKDKYVYGSEKVQIHEDYDGNVTNGKDIAMIKLQKSSSLTKPKIASKESNNFNNEQIFAIGGWGKSGPTGTIVGGLRVADKLPFVLPERCNAPDMYNGIIDNGMICAGNGISDACKGDSGGPLFIGSNGNGEKVFDGTPEEDLVVGITSFGATECGPTKYPGVYTSVAYYAEWISNVMEEEEKRDKEGSGSPKSDPFSFVCAYCRPIRQCREVEWCMNPAG